MRAPGCAVEEMWTPEPVEGWRFWNLHPALDGRLIGWRGVVWESAVMEAEHVDSTVRSRHTAPDPSCLCGVNALKVRAKALAFYLGDVVGRVAMSGVVDEYELGYRASRAEIVELVLLDGPLLTYAPGGPVAFDPAIADLIEAHYGIRPRIQTRNRWLEEMEARYGHWQADTTDHLGAGTGHGTGGGAAGEGAGQDGVTA